MCHHQTSPLQLFSKFYTCSTTTPAHPSCIVSFSPARLQLFCKFNTFLQCSTTKPAPYSYFCKLYTFLHSSNSHQPLQLFSKFYTFLQRIPLSHQLPAHLSYIVKFSPLPLVVKIYTFLYMKLSMFVSFYCISS